MSPTAPIAAGSFQASEPLSTQSERGRQTYTPVPQGHIRTAVRKDAPDIDVTPPLNAEEA